MPTQMTLDGYAPARAAAWKPAVPNQPTGRLPSWSKIRANRLFAGSN